MADYFYSIYMSCWLQCSMRGVEDVWYWLADEENQ